MPRDSTMTGERVYATLLLGDGYLSGALVLAHSLRDTGTAYKLAVLVTLDSVSAHAIAQLRLSLLSTNSKVTDQAVYDYILPVPRISNHHGANLHLMNRPDLHSAFTKINLWKQMQFDKIVYMDADVVVYRAPDELFDLPHAFAAAPDTGWPDLFNSGVMVLTPNMGDFYAMLAMAERGISFDGADQGLLNMHFGRAFHRLPFTYNVTPSAHYQYLPAYRHFRSSIDAVHFIGPNKPWFGGRDAPCNSSPYDEMVGRWWAVHDRHYRDRHTPDAPSSQDESQPTSVSTCHASSEAHEQDYREPAVVTQERQVSGETLRASSPAIPQQAHDHGAGPWPTAVSGVQASEPHHNQTPLPPPPPPPPTQTSGHRPEPLPMSTWDASRQPPPQNSKPEAIDFPSTHYEMSQDTKPFVPPARYPSPPKDMWYPVPQKPPAHPAASPPPIFPWEGNRPKPARVFVCRELETSQSAQVPRAQSTTGREPEAEGSMEEKAATTSQSEPQSPVTPSVRVTPSDPWTSFPRLNAWDDMPEIGRYVDGLKMHRRAKSQGAAVGGMKLPDLRPRTMRLTDFPSETERPSLPVTPAPVHRVSYWGGDESDRGVGDEAKQPVPSAEGVPLQTEWDPAEQLQKLAKQQSEAILRKLAAAEGGQQQQQQQQSSSPSSSSSSSYTRGGSVIPLRPLPFGSEPRAVSSPQQLSGRGGGSRGRG
ncbi:hypothetical protein L249_8183 [Ophiocordyceps polyrhachis-furcata BCC 54312]|uniref:glycogenin glucosyltransferase n=1 Tax=Ophiocordyceps polyrhachis-furcata BCC 54312 TaxID=1330021 RepID=A0A367LHM9_9HYPO|nr:hypothetical protein L249_8183 [Ophiocordyceps polyrhachis-furcata BCC 54312]